MILLIKGRVLPLNGLTSSPLDYGAWLFENRTYGTQFLFPQYHTLPYLTSFSSDHSARHKCSVGHLTNTLSTCSRQNCAIAQSVASCKATLVPEGLPVSLYDRYQRGLVRSQNSFGLNHPWCSSSPTRSGSAGGLGTRTAMFGCPSSRGVATGWFRSSRNL